MAHPLNDLLNRREGKTPVPCNDTCKYWRFPHLSCACTMSSVFSVNKGELCYEYEAAEEKDLEK